MSSATGVLMIYATDDEQQSYTDDARTGTTAYPVPLWTRISVGSLLIVDLKVVWFLLEANTTRTRLLGLPRFLQVDQISPSYLLPHSHKNFSSSMRNSSPGAWLRFLVICQRRGFRFVAGGLKELMAWAGLIQPTGREAFDSGHVRCQRRAW